MEKDNLVRYSLGILLAVVAINAIGGGVYGLSGAKAVPAEWLEGTPFTSYFIPSLILLIGVGGATLTACAAIFMRRQIAINMSYISGMILLVWIITQVVMIGYVSWLQPAMFMAAVLILVFTGMLQKEVS